MSDIKKVTVGIHQPNFFPWLGYFDKIMHSDVFVLMDDVAYPKSGSGAGSYTNRVAINIKGEPARINCPIRREKGSQLIKDVKVDDNQPWRKKLLRTLETYYCKAPNYAEMMPVLESLVRYETDSLSLLNMNAIRTITKLLGIETQFVIQSSLNTEKASTELLIEIVNKVGGTGYLCGHGASGYQQDELFELAGLELVFQDFKPMPYGDERRFLPGLSAIDYLMHAAELDQFANTAACVR